MGISPGSEWDREVELAVHTVLFLSSECGWATIVSVSEGTPLYINSPFLDGSGALLTYIHPIFAS
jgi:hypothetical protein